jgi:magnesium transporter
VVTVVAGIYGMNFENMPELHWHYGYAYVLSLMASLSAVLYAIFKRSGWL